MIWHIFMVLMMGIILPVMYFVLKNYGEANKDQLFGVTIGSEHMEEPEVKAIAKAYKKEMKRYTLLCLAILIGMIAIPFESIFYLVLMFWILLLIFLLEIPFIRASSAVTLKKLKMGWNGLAPQGSRVVLKAEERKHTYIKKGIWVGSLVALFLGILSIIAYILHWNERLVFIILSICYLTFLICFVFYLVCQAYRVPTNGIENAKDQDDYWIYGMFYYNKKDSSFLVEKRVGMGTTVNLARPAAKVSGILLALLMLLIPASSIWLVADEFTPVNLTISGDAVVSRQFEGIYTLPLTDIAKVELLKGFPESDKLVGTGLNNLYRGSFRVDGYDKCKVCLDPRNTAFLAITMEGGNVYILSDATDEGTMAVYDKLLLQRNDV